MTEQNTALAASAPSLARLLAIMARLRDPQGGCEWDLAQDFASIAPYTIEEAYEVADAIERNDLAALREELGDLLLQVVFHSRMAEEAGHFAFDDVAAAIADKMEDRHPHIFGGEDDQGQSREERWENRKEAERAAKGARARWTGWRSPCPH
jgi:ATP diphosphatase